MHTHTHTHGLLWTELTILCMFTYPPPPPPLIPLILHQALLPWKCLSKYYKYYHKNHNKPVMILLIFTLDCLTVSSISSFSLRATNGHHPLTLFCLKIEMVGRSCSFRIMSRVHCLAVFAPRGKRFRSSSIAPGNGESKISQFGIASTLFLYTEDVKKRMT